MTDQPRYSVGTWDTELQAFTPQEGLSVPSEGITLAQLRQAVRELRSMGYGAYRRRDSRGSYDDNDAAVLIERMNEAEAT